MSKKKLSVRERRRRQQQRQRMTVLMIVLGLVLIVAGILITPSIRQATQPVGDVVVPDFKTLPQHQANTMGDPNAPLTVVEFSDFQCPACKAFTDLVEETFIEEYVATGKVYFVYRSMGKWIGQESVAAIEAAYCAGEQNKFWEYHDILFANHTGENVGDFLEKRLIAFAENIDGLDVKAFRDCLDSDKYVQQANADFSDGRNLGVQGTPTLFVYITGSDTPLTPIQGVPQIAQLRQILDDALAQAEQ
ncbi:MAG TPA: hypothetical protein ENJ02_04925 [Chloroflexi bacterium]|nr:hypothetical protein [Chloroflexota bacterium]